MGKLIRTLTLGSYGKDVEAIARSELRFLNDDAEWAKFIDASQMVRRTFGEGKQTLTKRTQKKLGLRQSGAAGPGVYKGLRDAGAIDSVADELFDEYEESVRPKLLYPHPDVAGVYVGQGLHQTGGIPGNWAFDFMAHGGTKIVCPCEAVIIRFSGHSPSTGTHGAVGDVFGWSMYFEDTSGREYYMTHMGSRSVTVGQRVKPGHPLGSVGHWPHDPGRSHTHLGVSSPRGSTEAKARITAISKAPKVAA